MAEPHTSLWEAYQEGTQFFMQTGDIYQTLRRLAARLQAAGLDYAVVGGMALVAHGYRRFTEDIDILLTPEALAHFQDEFVGRGYARAFSSAAKTFRDTETNVRIEVLTTGDYPGDGLPKPVAFPEPAAASFEQDGLRILTLEKLIELKLASGLSAPHRLRDLADVQELIALLRLPLELQHGLDESVRAEYRRLWDTTQTSGRQP